MMIPLGVEEKESFIFPNNFEINIDYGIIGKSSLFNEDYISGVADQDVHLEG